MKEQFLGLLAGFIVKVYSSTFRYKFYFSSDSEKSLIMDDLNVRGINPGKNFIYATFHQDEISCIPLFKDKQITVMVSQSADGTILATALEYLGYGTIRGSSHRGGVGALLQGTRKAQEGYKLAIAVDGPRGPLYEVKEGVISISHKTKRPIVPVRSKAKWCFTFTKSWSKSRLPLPFSRIDVYMGRIGFYTSTELKQELLFINPSWIQLTPHT